MTSKSVLCCLYLRDSKLFVWAKFDKGCLVLFVSQRFHLICEGEIGSCLLLFGMCVDRHFTCVCKSTASPVRPVYSPCRWGLSNRCKDGSSFSVEKNMYKCLTTEIRSTFHNIYIVLQFVRMIHKYIFFRSTVLKQIGMIERAHCVQSCAPYDIITFDFALVSGQAPPS